MTDPVFRFSTRIIVSLLVALYAWSPLRGLAAGLIVFIGTAWLETLVGESLRHIVKELRK